MGALLRQTAYGGSENDPGSCFVLIPDEGVVISGTTNSSGSGNVDVYITRTDSTANAVWDLTYDGGYGNHAGYSPVASWDCGHIIVGSSVPKAGDRDLLIPGVDQDGKVYVSDRSSSFGGGGYDLVLLQDDSDGDLLSQPV